MKSNRLAKTCLVLVMAGCIAGGASTICAKWNKDPYEKYYNMVDKATEYIEQGYYVDAINELEAAEKIKTDMDVEITIAECYFATGDYINFSSKLDSIEKTYGKNERIYIDKAIYYAQNYQADAAIAEMIEAKEKYPHSEQILAIYDQVKGLYTQEGDSYVYRADLCGGYDISEKETFKDRYEEVFDVSDDASVGTVWSGSKEIIAAKVDGVSGYYDIKGNKRVSPETNYTYLGGYRDGYALVQGENGWGYIDESFEEQEVWYEAATSFNEGVAAVKKDGKWALIDTTFNPITEYVYDDIVTDNFERCYVGATFAKKDGRYVMLDAKGNVLKDDIQAVDMFRSENDYAAVLDADGWHHIDTSGEIIYSVSCDELRASSENIAAVRAGDKWGFVGVNDGTYVEVTFDDAGYVNDAGYVAVKNGDDWSMIHFTRIKKDEGIF